MRTWQRIILVTFVLIGGTAFFGYWSLNQFDSVFDTLSYLDTANTSVLISSSKKDVEVASTSLPEIFATSTSEIISGLATATTTSEIATSTSLEFYLTFPKEGDELYIGCMYELPLQSSMVISSLDTSLIDAGTREAIGPVASGLARENKISSASQILDWKIGAVWPGEYYIKMSNINGVDLENKSKVFKINKISGGVSIEERGEKCNESGGSF